MENGPSPIASELDDSFYISRQSYEQISLVEGIYSVAQAPDPQAEPALLTSERSQTIDDSDNSENEDAVNGRVNLASSPIFVENDEKTVNVMKSDGSSTSGHKDYNTTQILESVIDGPLSQPKYSIIPPRTARHAQYPKYVQNDVHKSPISGYTQILIWCLQRRISNLEKTPPPELKMANVSLLLNVLKKMQTGLIDGEIKPQPQSKALINLKPMMPNPANERCAEILKLLQDCKLRLNKRLDRLAIVFAETEQRLLTSSETAGKPVQLDDHKNDDKYNLMVQDIHKAIKTNELALREYIDQANTLLAIVDYKLALALEREKRLISRRLSARI